MNKVTPKDFFLHLGATIALYASAIALINLTFTIINHLFKDVLNPYWSVDSVVWPISFLIVLIPILFIFESVLKKEFQRLPEKREIWIRRWRIYLTLFLTGVTIAIDLIILINTYLNGEITSRFILKVLVTLVVSLIIFAYYLLERRTVSSHWSKILSWIGIVLILAAIVGGFIIVGSPAKQRALRLDQEKVQNLYEIQSQIINFWTYYQSLPLALTDPTFLNAVNGGRGVPVDRLTKQPFEYRKITENSFELCAIFNASSTDSVESWLKRPVLPESEIGIFDEHPAGRTCFVRTVDTKRYPPAQAQLKPLEAR